YSRSQRLGKNHSSSGSVGGTGRARRDQTERQKNRNLRQAGAEQTFRRRSARKPRQFSLHGGRNRLDGQSQLSQFLRPRRQKGPRDRPSKYGVNRLFISLRPLPA